MGGFTIVELLIVIVVIAILAAITIIAYNGIQNRSYNVSVEADLSNVAKKLEIYKIQNDAYPINITELDAADFKASLGSYYVISGRANFYYCTDNTNPTTYAIGVISKSKQGYYMINGKVTASAADSTGSLWAANTCSQIGLTAGDSNVTSPSGLNGSTGIWADWVQ